MQSQEPYKPHEQCVGSPGLGLEGVASMLHFKHSNINPLSRDVDNFFGAIGLFLLFEIPWNATADMICQVSLDDAQGCAGTLDGDV